MSPQDEKRRVIRYADEPVAAAAANRLDDDARHGAPRRAVHLMLRDAITRRRHGEL